MCGFSFSQSTFRFPPFNQGYRVRICHPIYLYSLFPMMNYLGLFWWRTAAGAGVAVGTPLSFCSYLLHVWGGMKPLTSGEALGWLSAGAPQTGGLVGAPLQRSPTSLADAAAPLQLLLLVEDFASGGFSCTSLPHPLFSLIRRILETLWLSFAYGITQKRKNPKTQQLRFFKANWEL